jgi:hypothetical protein
MAESIAPHDDQIRMALLRERQDAGSRIIVARYRFDP